MGSKGYIVEDPSIRTNYVQIPHIIINTPELSHPAFRLYIWYKKICGEEEGGTCWQSIKTICDGCSMNSSTAIKARRELESFGLIGVTRTKKQDGTKEVRVFIVDVWAVNCAKIGNESLSKIGIGGLQNRELAGSKIGKQIRTLRNKNPNSMSQPFGSDGKCSFPPSSDGRKGKRTATSFDHKASAELHKVVSGHIKVNCTASNKQWANQFSLMRTVDKVPKKDIRTAIEWYGENIGKEYVIEAFSAASFRKKYATGQIPAAMKRNGGGGSHLDDPRTERQRTVDRVLDHLRKDGTWAGNYDDPPDQPDVDRALVALGKKRGEVSSGDCMS